MRIRKRLDEFIERGARAIPLRVEVETIFDDGSAPCAYVRSALGTDGKEWFVELTDLELQVFEDRALNCAASESRPPLT
jgi:hypothetical protein